MQVSVVLCVSCFVLFKMAHNLRDKPRVDYMKLNEGHLSGSEDKIFTLFTKSSSDVPGQGVCGGAEDKQDSELRHLKELLAPEERTQSDVKLQRKEAEHAKEKDRLQARLDKLHASLLKVLNRVNLQIPLRHTIYGPLILWLVRLKNN